MFNRKKKEPEFKRQEVTEEDFPEEQEDTFDDELIEEIQAPRPQYAEQKNIPSRMNVPIKSRVQPTQVVKQEPIKEQVVESIWSVEEVPTQTQPIIFNSKEKRAYTIYEVLVELLKRTED